METKKISFGFSKVSKKPNFIVAKPLKRESKVELIKCLEGQEIKLINEKQKESALIIPMQTNQKTSTALASLMKRRAVLLDEEKKDETAGDLNLVKPTEIVTTDEVTGTGEDIEKRAARELLAAVSTNTNSDVSEQNKLVLPALKADQLQLDGAKESTVDDYESVPIQQFGLAMLRGMGWVDPPKKNGNGEPIDEIPFLRPKGMGLGADKALKAKPLLVQPEKNEVLEIKKQAYVRILGGKHKDLYGQIEGFDDHAGRVIVKMAIGAAKEAFNEFLCQPVSKKEYAQYSKCINTVKYEEYKKLENEHGQIIIKTEKHEVSVERKADSREHYKHKDEFSEHKYKNKQPISVKVERNVQKYKNDEQRTNNNTHQHYSDSRERNRHEDYSINKHDKTFVSDTPWQHTDSRSSRYLKDDEQSSSRSRSRTQFEHERHASREKQLPCASNSRHRLPSKSGNNKADNRHLRNNESDAESHDTSASTQTDTDSAYEKKQQKTNKKKKSKSKKHHKHRDYISDGSSSSEDNNSSEKERARRRRSKHKKKTKKSKHVRSRTRSRSRSRI